MHERPRFLMSYFIGYRVNYQIKMVLSEELLE